MTTTMLRPPLVRPRAAVIGGVCLGLANHLRWPVGRVRLGMVALAVLGGGGLLLYLWLWVLVPLEAPENEDAKATRRMPVAGILVVIAALASIGGVVAALSGQDGALSTALIVVTVTSGSAVAWSLTMDRHDPARSPRYSNWARGAASVLLFLSGVVALLNRPSALNAVIGVGMVVLGVAVLVAPQVVKLWSDLMTERAARIREVQRAEIAAHLHDSVLQTLALIQNRAGASSEVARIARAQERELREWLFATDQPATADLATDLRAIAAAIELDYPARIEVVTAGEPVTRSSPALVAAAREAILNAARHAGGEVSVYLETTARATDVFIRDRGPGVSLKDVPADRLGIRESIIGRMTRAGGTATVRTGTDGSGTEVHLHLEASGD